MNKQISVWAIIKKTGDTIVTFGWATLGWWLAWIGAFVGVSLGVSAALGVVVGVGTWCLQNMPVLGIMLTLLGMVIALIAIGIFFKLAAYVPLLAALAIYHAPAKSLSIATIRKSFRYKHAFRLMGYTVLYMLIVLIGICLLIIPGVIAMTRLSFGPLFIVTQNQSVIESLRSSYRLTQGNFWRVCLLNTIRYAIRLFMPASELLYVTTFYALSEHKPAHKSREEVEYDIE